MSAGLRFAHDEIRPLADGLAELLRPQCERLEIAGSLRRKATRVGDIELVAIPRLKAVGGPRQLTLFGGAVGGGEAASRNLLWGALDELKVPYKRRGDLYRRFEWQGIDVDLFTCWPQNWGWILLHRTGPARFRGRIGWILSNRGFPAIDGWIYGRAAGNLARIPTPEEHEVFRLAGLPYLPPEERE